MNEIPVTSVTLLKAVASDAQHVRWTELHDKYEGLMRAWLHERYPSLEPEDVMQETMIVLAKKLPDYDYQPDAKGHFRNYLIGILKHKAQNAIARRSREGKIRTALQNEPAAACEEKDWRTAALEVALSRLLADQTINPLHRNVFRHVALLHEKPEAVAERFGTSRANVDIIKKRMIARLQNLVSRLTRLTDS